MNAAEPDPSAITAVKRFFFALTVQDGPALWEELSEEGRAYVLNVAVRQGMDFELHSRLRQGSSSDEELTGYLENLVWGIRRDLDGIDLSHLSYEAETTDSGAVLVKFMVPLGLTLPRARNTVDSGPTESPQLDPRAVIPAGSAVLVRERGRWRITRLIPRPG